MQREGVESRRQRRRRQTFGKPLLFGLSTCQGAAAACAALQQWRQPHARRW